MAKHIAGPSNKKIRNRKYKSSPQSSSHKNLMLSVHIKLLSAGSTCNSREPKLRRQVLNCITLLPAWTPRGWCQVRKGKRARGHLLSWNVLRTTTEGVRFWGGDKAAPKRHSLVRAETLICRKSALSHHGYCSMIPNLHKQRIKGNWPKITVWE